MKKLAFGMFVSLTLLASGGGVHADEKSCLPIGGTALGTIYGGNQIVAAMSGTWTSARGEIKSQKETATGLSLEMEHVFAPDDGGFVRTRDTAEFTAVPGKDQIYMVELAYTVVESEGPLAGYGGTFYSFGLIKMGEGEAVVRYKGEICK